MFIFNNHKNLEGTHAFMGASTSSWLNWSKDLTIERYLNSFAQLLGTTLHDFAKDCIKNKLRLYPEDHHLIDYICIKQGIPKEAYDTKKILENLVPYVNDAIAFNATPEVLLYYSPFCYGTTDAIVYDPNTLILRIFDYKSGTTKTRLEQCRIYAALFCLEYHIDPYKLKEIDLRIYQLGEIHTEPTTPEMIKDIMNNIVEKNENVTEVYERNYR